MIRKIIITGIFVTACFSCAGKPYKSNQAASQTYGKNTTAKNDYRDIDNTAQNKGGSTDNTPVPTDQIDASNTDVELTRKIRDMLTDENSLSIKAQNVKIITLNGITTLRGPVNTLSEKETIERLARSAGAKSIENQLEVTTQSE